ncbi:MAG: hypothetical protein II388_10565 [Clostridia bacterium]|nr:hypothetical protein [Clostridia bacterium]
MSLTICLLVQKPCGVYEDDTKNESSARVFKVSKTVTDDLREYGSWSSA